MIPVDDLRADVDLQGDFRKKRRIRCSVAEVAVIGLLSIFALQPSKAEKKPKAPPPQPINASLQASVPSMALLEGTDASQLKGGLRISLQQETFDSEVTMTESRRQIAPPSKWGLVVMPAPGAIYVETTQSPQIRVKPDHLVFHIHISNQLPRVFRGAGILVQFNIAGKVINVDPSGYGDLVNVIIPPRSEQELTIVGPEVANVPSPSTIGVFLYDVVTNMDQAGNITEKTNFEWYYSFRTQTTEKIVTVPAPTQAWQMPN